MADEKKEGEVLQDRLAQGFGLIIAYICPGFLALIGLQLHFPVLQAWLGTAASAETTTGSFLFAIMGALAVSMFLLSIGSFLIEDVLGRIKKFNLPEQSDIPEKARKHPGIESAYRDLRDQHYRYYQFYASMVVVVPIFYLEWLRQHAFNDSWIINVAAIVTELLFVHRAFEQLKRYRNRRSSLLASVQE